MDDHTFSSKFVQVHSEVGNSSNFYENLGVFFFTILSMKEHENIAVFHLLLFRRLAIVLRSPY